MRLTLVTMPWYTLDGPSTALGVLHAALSVRAPEIEVRECYANIEWADHVMRATDGELGVAAYNRVIDDGSYESVGDWIFSNALYGVPERNVEEFRKHLASRDKPFEEFHRYHLLAPAFIAELADRLVAEAPDVVGFSTTYNQNVASLALAKAIHDRAPGIVIIFGGANCDAPQGSALQRGFPFIDYVVSGEGEESLPALLAAIAEDREPEGIGGVSWWSASAGGAQRVNPDPTRMISLVGTPVPEFDAYFERFARSELTNQMDQFLILESSRGCWWGEKHRCTFCGVNNIAYRAKPGEQMFEEFRALMGRHQVLDLILCDNIFDMRYFKTFLPHLREEGWDMRLVYSVKSNLHRDHLEALREVGVFHIQPGIESLANTTLRIMDKGVTAAQNVTLLRDCTELGMEVGWAQLYGFPGETEADYEPIFSQMSALVHLVPPMGASRISLERYSVLFDRGAEIFEWMRPAESYRYIYDTSSMSEADFADIVYIYDYPHAGLLGEAVDRLHRLVAEWRDGYDASSLTQDDTAAGLLIRDRRVGWPEADYLVSDPAMAAAYRALAMHMRPHTLRDKLAEAGHEVAEDALRAQLAEWRGHGLVFEDEDSFVALATRPYEPFTRRVEESFYWRLGPGFVEVRDHRGPGVALRHVIDGEHFEAFAAVAAGEKLNGRARQLAPALEDLLSLGVLAREGEDLRVVPARMLAVDPGGNPL